MQTFILILIGAAIGALITYLIMCLRPSADEKYQTGTGKVIEQTRYAVLVNNEPAVVLSEVLSGIPHKFARIIKKEFIKGEGRGGGIVFDRFKFGIEY